ncbi:MAG: GtrA family protein [Bacteroidales bacterium]
MLELARRIRNLIILIVDWLHQPFARFIPVETFRYAATGGANTFLDIFLYFLTYNFVLRKQMVTVANVTITPHIAAFLIVFPITFLTGFILAKYVTFTTSMFRGRKQLLRYGITVIGAILLNYVLLKFFVEQCRIYPTPSKIITTVVVVIYSYVMQRYFSFKTGNIRKLRLSRVNPAKKGH